MLRYIVLPHISSCEIFEYVSYYLSVVKFHGKEVVGGIAAITGMTADDLGKFSSLQYIRPDVAYAVVP